MLHGLPHVLRALWGERIALFWPIWIAITVIGVMMVILVLPQRENIPLPSIKPGRRDLSRQGVLALGFLGLFLACYIAGSLAWEDFTYYDNSHYTNGTLLGRDIPVQISPEAGRFWPLGHQEFNLVRHFTHSVRGYHAFRIVELLLLCGILMVLDEGLSIQARVALILLALITPSILISFSGLIYAEANILFWLVCLAWCVKQFGQTESKAWAVAALISSQFMLYYKETAFVLLLGFAIGRLVLRCWKVHPAGWDFKRLREPESRLDMCLALIVIPFLLYYLAAMYPNYRTGYTDDFRLPLSEVLASYLKLDLLAWVFVAVTSARFILILRRKVVPSLFWDGLALAGIGCFVSYIILHMESAYYLAPVDLIAVLYVGRLVIPSMEKMSIVNKSWALALLLLVLVQDISLSAFRMYERKNVIHAKTEISRVIKARYVSNPQNVKRLFFPFTNPFHILEFASYLNYTGVPVEEVPVGPAAAGYVEMVGEAIQKDGPCGYRTFVCHPASRPDPGDLVVVLPDDLTQTDELNTYRQRGAEMVFSYSPRPSIPQWLLPYVDRLHVVSPVFAHQQLPESWLSASVTAWK